MTETGQVKEVQRHVMTKYSRIDESESLMIDRIDSFATGWFFANRK